MNWLAHLFLSDPEPACRIGNLLPDFLSANVLATLPAEFQRGIAQHRRIRTELAAASYRQFSPHTQS